MIPNVSLFCSAVRTKLWPSLFKSLEGTSVSYQIWFAGNVLPDQAHPQLRHVLTENIKPAQCYEIARRHCTGEVVVWIADDCEFPNDVIGKVYKYWKSQNNEKLILSIQTKESGENTPVSTLFNMNEHRFFSWVPDSPLMAPLGMMSRKFLDELGGLDKRYICGQYENDIVMRAYQQDAKVEIFGDPDCYIDIDHLRKSIEIGESKTAADFIYRPFAKGYPKDREVLENSWTTFDQDDVFRILHSGERPLTLRKISPIQLDKFEPYEDIDLLTKSQSNNLTDRWV